MSFLSLFIASLLGSPHCLGMCGGFVGWVTTQSPHPIRSQFLYHTGRIFIYVILGALAGAIGQSLDQVAFVAGMNRLSPLLVGIFLITQGVLLLIGRRALELPWLGKWLPRMEAWLSRAWKKNPNSPSLMALLMGVLTGFLPCGWLYSFIVLAISSGGPAHGALMLLVFGLGTLPLLVTFGTSFRVLIQKLGMAPLRVTSFLLILGGIFSLGQHLGYFSSWMGHSHSGHSQESQPSHHHH